MRSFPATSKLAWHKFGPALLIAGALVLVALTGARVRGLLLNTAVLTAGAAALALPLGVVLALAVAKVDVPGRRLLGWLLVGMLFVPLYAQAGAWRSLLGLGGWLTARGGAGYVDPWLDGWRGAIWVHAMAAVPWAALAIAAALAAVERRFEEQALLDAPSWRVLLSVSLRGAAPGFAAAFAWIAATCATEITVTDLFQLRTFAEEVYTEASLGALVGPPPGGGASAVTLGAMPTDPFHAGDLARGVVALALVLAAAAWLAAPWLAAVTATPEGDPWRWRPQPRWACGVVVLCLVAAVVLLPLAGLVAKAGIEVHQAGNAYVRSWSPVKVATMVGRAPWEHRREWAWSFMIGALAAAATTALAFAAAWLVRGKPRRAVGLAAALALLAAIPAPLWGVWIISLFNQPPDSPLAVLTILYDRTLAAPILVQTLRALPLVTLWLWAHLATLAPVLFDAARCEGAGGWTQFWRIALPLRRPAVVAGLAAALAIAIAELSATLLVLPPGVNTISVAVFQFLHFPAEDRMAALCLSIFGIVGAGVAAVAWFPRRP